MVDMRTPFNRVSGLGSTRQGTGHFWQQRLTAVANVPLVLFFVWLLLSHLGAGRAALAAAFHNPLVLGAGVLAIASIGWHMRLGMQVVIEDYVENEAARVLLVALNSLFAFAVMSVGGAAVLLLGFGG